MKQHSRYSAPLLVAAMAALALGACSKNDERTASQRVDATVAQVQRQAAEVKAEAKQASDGVNDAAIISSVNAEFTRDGKLDPAKIDIDAQRGRVVLRGTAPDAEAVARARQIVLAIKGVTGVDNYLTVNQSS